MKAIIGLGNFGRKYLKNRHNVGFRVIDCLASQHKVKLRRVLGQKSWQGRLVVGSDSFLLVKPRTFMNNSGYCVLRVLARYKVSIQNLLVVYDDADLDFGFIRIRKSGSSAGHRGIASVMNVLGRQDIARLKVGIGRFSRADLADYVLADFSQEETKKISLVISQAAQASLEWFKERKEKTLNVDLN